MPRNLLCSLLTSGRKPETYSRQHTSRCPEPRSSSACLLEAANSQQSILKLLSQKPSSRQSTWRSWLRFSPLLGEQCLSKKQGDSRGHELLPHLSMGAGQACTQALTTSSAPHRRHRLLVLTQFDQCGVPAVCFFTALFKDRLVHFI